MVLKHIAASALALTLGLQVHAASAAGLGIGGEAHARPGRPIAFAPGADHAAEASTLVWVNKPGAAKGVSKVIIPFFQVQFVTESRADALNVSTNTSSSMSATLDGPTTAQMQQIVDALYADFVGRLQAAGVEVVGREQAAAFPAWAQMLAEMKPSGQSVSGMNKITSTFVAPTGLGFYLLPVNLPQYAGGGSFEVMGNTGMIRHEADLMAQSGAAVLGFRAVVDFAELKSSDNGAFGHHAGFVWTKGRMQVAISPISTQMFLLTPAAKGTVMDPLARLRFELAAPLVVDTGAILAVQDATTGAQRLDAAAASVVSILGGGGGYSIKRYAVRVDPAIWQADVTGALEGVADMMVRRLAADR